MIKKNIILKILIITIINCINLFSQESVPKIFNTDFKITTNKNKYCVCEPICLSVKVSNHNSPGPEITGMYILSNLSIKNKENEECIFTGVNIPIYVGPMAENEIREYNLVITKSYDNNEIAKYYNSDMSIIVPGEYKISCTYNEPGALPLESNILKITVNEPEGEDLAVFKKFISVYNRGTYKKDHHLALNVFNTIIDEYPASIYNYNALTEKHLLLRLKMGDPERIDQLTIEIIKKYPDNPKLDYYVRALLNYYESINKTEKGIEILEKISETSTSSWQKKVINKAIRKSREQYH